MKPFFFSLAFLLWMPFLSAAIPDDALEKIENDDIQEQIVFGNTQEHTANNSPEHSESFPVVGREVKFSYYYPLDKTVREIYDGGAMYGLEASLFFNEKKVCLFTGVNFLPLSGHSIGQEQDTDLLLIPIEAGLKYILSQKKKGRTFYVGAGVLPTYLHTKDDSPFVARKRTKWGVGGIFQGGMMLFLLPRQLSLDVFVNYIYLTMDFSDTKDTFGKRSDLSGLSLGTGLAYKF